MNTRPIDVAGAPQAAPQRVLRKDLLVAVLLVRLLERLERDARGPDAGQYRSVVRHLAAELERLPRDEMLESLLAASPAASAVYENLQYAHAGLCRSPLEAATHAELLARETLARAARSV